jgi:hypothetical protein
MASSPVVLIDMTVEDEVHYSTKPLSFPKSSVEVQYCYATVLIHAFWCLKLWSPLKKKKSQTAVCLPPEIVCMIWKKVGHLSCYIGMVMNQFAFNALPLIPGDIPSEIKKKELFWQHPASVLSFDLCNFGDKPVEYLLERADQHCKNIDHLRNSVAVDKQKIAALEKRIAQKKRSLESAEREVSFVFFLVFTEISIRLKRTRKQGNSISRELIPTVRLWEECCFREETTPFISIQNLANTQSLQPATATFTLVWKEARWKYLI